MPTTLSFKQECLLIRFCLRSLLGCVAVFLACANAHAGVIIDGLPDSSYTMHANLFAASGSIGGGSGTLISPHWVLGAAHVGPASSFVLNGIAYPVSQTIPHPTYVSNGSNLNFGYDLALYHLPSPVTSVAAVPIYRGTGELGSEVSIAGYGRTGVGLDPTPANPGTHRAGTNVVDLIISYGNGPAGQVGAPNAGLLLDFDAPSGIGNPGQYNTLSSFGSSANVTSLEYHVAGGDSGGGLYIVDGGITYLAGVASGVQDQQMFYDQAGIAQPGNTNQFGYGAVSLFSRVGSYQPFIDGTIASLPEPTSLVMVGFVVAIASLRRSKRELAVA